MGVNFICKLRNGIYGFQKLCLNTVLEKKISPPKAIHLVEYLKNYYFTNSNNLFLNNDNIINLNFLEHPENIEALMSKTNLDQLIKNETNLIIQALNTCTNIISILGFNSMVIIILETKFLYFLNINVLIFSSKKMYNY